MFLLKTDVYVFKNNHKLIEGIKYRLDYVLGVGNSSYNLS